MRSGIDAITLQNTQALPSPQALSLLYMLTPYKVDQNLYPILKFHIRKPSDSWDKPCTFRAIGSCQDAERRQCMGTKVHEQRCCEGETVFIAVLLIGTQGYVENSLRFSQGEKRLIELLPGLPAR